MKTIEQIHDTLVIAMSDTHKALEDIEKKYEGGGFYSTEDSSYQDYFEGQICAYEHAIALLRGED
jgi:hypothetical protein